MSATVILSKPSPLVSVLVPAVVSRYLTALAAAANACSSSVIYSKLDCTDPSSLGHVECCFVSNKPTLPPYSKLDHYCQL